MRVPDWRELPTVSPTGNSVLPIPFGKISLGDPRWSGGSLNSGWVTLYIAFIRSLFDFRRIRRRRAIEQERCKSFGFR